MKLSALLMGLAPDLFTSHTVSIEDEGASGGGGGSVDGDDAAGTDDADTDTDDGDDDDTEDTDDDESDGAAASGEPKKVKPKETAAQRRARLSKDRDVARIVKAASAKAVREALAAAEAEAKKKADRDKLDAQERLEAEKAELQTERDKAIAERDEFRLELGFHRTMAATGLVLVDPEDMPYVQSAAAKAMDGDDLSIEDALAQIAEQKPHWFKTAGSDAGDAEADRKVKAKKRKEATTTASGKGKGTESSSDASDTKTTAEKVRNMPTKDFAAEVQAKYGVRLPH